MSKEEIARPVPQLAAGHAVRLDNRERLSIDGVQDVAGFDENMVVLTTALGDLTVRGEGLHIEKIDLDSGRLELHGKVSELSYDEPASGGGWWSRLFG
jgi:sporulation protein YabP